MRFMIIGVSKPLVEEITAKLKNKTHSSDKFSPVIVRKPVTSKQMIDTYQCKYNKLKFDMTIIAIDAADIHQITGLHKVSKQEARPWVDIRTKKLTKSGIQELADSNYFKKLENGVIIVNTANSSLTELDQTFLTKFNRSHGLSQVNIDTNNAGDNDYLQDLVTTVNANIGIKLLESSDYRFRKSGLNMLRMQLRLWIAQSEQHALYSYKALSTNFKFFANRRAESREKNLINATELLNNLEHNIDLENGFSATSYIDKYQDRLKSSSTLSEFLKQNADAIRTFEHSKTIEMGFNDIPSSHQNNNKVTKV